MLGVCARVCVRVCARGRKHPTEVAEHFQHSGFLDHKLAFFIS